MAQRNKHTVVTEVGTFERTSASRTYSHAIVHLGMGVSWLINQHIKAANWDAKELRTYQEVLAGVQCAGGANGCSVADYQRWVLGLEEKLRTAVTRREAAVAANDRVIKENRGACLGFSSTLSNAQRAAEGWRRRGYANVQVVPVTSVVVVVGKPKTVTLNTEYRVPPVGGFHVPLSNDKSVWTDDREKLSKV